MQLKKRMNDQSNSKVIEFEGTFDLLKESSRSQYLLLRLKTKEKSMMTLALERYVGTTYLRYLILPRCDLEFDSSITISVYVSGIVIQHTS